jgi:hypothetical protein
MNSLDAVLIADVGCLSLRLARVLDPVELKGEIDHLRSALWPRPHKSSVTDERDTSAFTGDASAKRVPGESKSQIVLARAYAENVSRLRRHAVAEHRGGVRP